MWNYQQDTGDLSLGGTFYERGYSGHGDGLNNPALQAVHNVGPLPKGFWRMGAPVDHERLGSLAIPLYPCEGTETFGRTGFYVHGDELGAPGQFLASDGCAIFSHATRMTLNNSPDKILEVI